MFSHHRRNDKGRVIGASLVGMAMGVVIGMLFGSKKDESRIEKAKNWSTDMAEELNRRVDDMRDMTAERYNQVVDELAEKYKKVKGIKETEVDDFVKDLKMRWDRIKDQWNS